MPASGTEADVPLQMQGVVSHPLLGEALRCATEGQRVAVVVPLAELLQGADPAEAGLSDVSEKDSIVVAVDTTKITRGEGETAACKKLDKRDEKYPEVELGDGKSEPKITIPECMEPPAELELEVLTEGDGAVVEDGDTVMTNYVGVDWNGAERFDG